jgi:hypothetical protein
MLCCLENVVSIGQVSKGSPIWQYGYHRTNDKDGRKDRPEELAMACTPLGGPCSSMGLDLWFIFLCSTYINANPSSVNG